MQPEASVEPPPRCRRRAPARPGGGGLRAQGVTSCVSAGSRGPGRPLSQRRLPGSWRDRKWGLSRFRPGHCFRLRRPRRRLEFWGRGPGFLVSGPGAGGEVLLGPGAARLELRPPTAQVGYASPTHSSPPRLAARSP